ncbi:MAG: DUF1653 domain-containing protein [Bacilli bacterium]|jgi:hypothetical protein
MIEDELVQTMNNSMKDHIYRHFKGNLYKVVCIANNTETEELSVVYKGLVDGRIWVRPYSMWNEIIDEKGTKRFTEV